ncbi:FAD-dependent oxidoreductase [Bacteroidota bacterium]
MKSRSEIIQQIQVHPEFDIIVIGGGASGIGTALEASLRGYRTLLLEKHDFTKGTSSKSTKLIHGGVRYMAQGDLKMVVEALKERGYLVRNAPHLVHDQPFIIPVFSWWAAIYYTIGLKFYDLLSGKLSLGRSVFMKRKAVLEKLEGISSKGLKGGVKYHDGQFDDSRLAIDLLHAHLDKGGLALNYAEVTTLLKNSNGDIQGVRFEEQASKQSIEVKAKTVINACGVWVDDVLTLDEPDHEKYIRPSQGIHLVLHKKFLPGTHALMIPKTSDGRVLFAVPWHDHLVVGTTDTPIDRSDVEPLPLAEEIAFIIETASHYLSENIERKDVLAVFAGLRPLAAPQKGSSKTKEISRNHKVILSKSKLISVIGGKWTTYRKMAEDIISVAIKNKLLPPSKSISKDFALSEAMKPVQNKYASYGRNASHLHMLEESGPELSKKAHPQLPYTWAELIYCCKHEMVEHLEDLLARRTRALFLNARATTEIAETVARKIAPDLDWNQERIEMEVKNFKELADKYILK